MCIIHEDESRGPKEDPETSCIQYLLIEYSESQREQLRVGKRAKYFDPNYKSALLPFLLRAPRWISEQSLSAFHPSHAPTAQLLFHHTLIPILKFIISKGGSRERVSK